MGKRLKFEQKIEYHFLKLFIIDYILDILVPSLEVLYHLYYIIYTCKKYILSMNYRKILPIRRPWLSNQVTCLLPPWHIEF